MYGRAGFALLRIRVLHSTWIKLIASYKVRKNQFYILDNNAFHWQRLLDEGIAASGSAIAQREALIADRQPRTMTLRWFQRNPLPVDWEEQREIVKGLGE